jgi:tetratricopeptide (TPR) repeat protein
MVAEEAPKFWLLVIGRLHSLTRKHLREVVQQAGGDLAAQPSSRVNLVALAHRSAPAMLRDAPPLALPKGVDQSARVISEMTLKRMLRLVQAPAADDRTLDQADVLRASKLSHEALCCFVAFDVLEPVNSKFTYRDVLVAREVKRLVDQDYGLATIVEASFALRRSRLSLAEARLEEAPWGELVLQNTHGGLASLGGQLVLPLPHEGTSADDLFEHAEVAEASGDLVSAEHLYRAALATDWTDAVIPYNLANVLDAQGRRQEAILAYYKALQRDPGFAEAWFNLGVIDEEQGRRADAITHYRLAVSAQPNFGDAVFNLALLLTEQEAYDEAALLWRRFIALNPLGPDNSRAKRFATLCRHAQAALAKPPLPTATSDPGVCGGSRQALLW